MLKIINNLSQLKFSNLMYVYSEGNLENGAERYPQLQPAAQIREAELDFYGYLSDVFFNEQDAFYAVWETGNRYVSALRIESYQDGWLLSALETAPSDRRRGYATHLINAVKKYLVDLGDMKLYSHVSKRNQASLATHLNCNFQIALDYAVYLDVSVNQKCYTLVYDSKKCET